MSYDSTRPLRPPILRHPAPPPVIIGICKYCLDPIYANQEREPAFGRDRVGHDPEGEVHSGPCAKQWKLRLQATTR